MPFNGIVPIQYWNAATNQPPIVSGRGISGTAYIISVPGNTLVDGVSDWEVGDWICFGLDKWYKIFAGITAGPDGEWQIVSVGRNVIRQLPLITLP